MKQETIIENPLDYKIIDAHVHLFPDKLFERIWDYFSHYGWDVKYRWFSERAAEHLLDNGVESFWFSNYAHRPKIAAGLIDYSLRLLDRFPAARYWAAVHPEDSDLFDYLDRALSHPKVLGLKVQLLVQCFPIDLPKMIEVYRRVIEAEKAILFHIGTGPVGNEFVGFTHFRRLLDRLPELKCQIAHLGAYEIDQFFDYAIDRDNLWFDSSFTFVEAPNYPSFTKLINRDRIIELSDKIVYGSDFPDIPFDRLNEIINIRSLNFGEDIERKIFVENARRFEAELLPIPPQ